MARARNIKPSFFQNDMLAEISPLGRLLFIGMWTICDYRGCLEYRPKRIRAQILPYDNCDVDALLSDLDKSGFIAIYSVRGSQYIKVINFERHQNPHKNERDGGTELPDITEKDNEISTLEFIEKNRDQNGTDRADSPFLIPPSLILNPESPNPNVANAPVGFTDDGRQEIIPERRASVIEVLVDKDSSADVVVTKVEKVREAVGDDVRAVFTHWQQAMNHDRAQLDVKRQKAIKARLKDGYSVADLCLAVDGCLKSPYHMGDNDSRTVYDDIELICRDGPKVDFFIKKGQAQPELSPKLQRQAAILKDWI